MARQIGSLSPAVRSGRRETRRVIHCRQRISASLKWIPRDDRHRFLPYQSQRRSSQRNPEALAWPYRTNAHEMARSRSGRYHVITPSCPPDSMAARGMARCSKACRCVASEPPTGSYSSPLQVPTPATRVVGPAVPKPRSDGHLAEAHGAYWR